MCMSQVGPLIYGMTHIDDVIYDMTCLQTQRSTCAGHKCTLSYGKKIIQSNILADKIFI